MVNPCFKLLSFPSVVISRPHGNAPATLYVHNKKAFKLCASVLEFSRLFNVFMETFHKWCDTINLTSLRAQGADLCPSEIKTIWLEIMLPNKHKILISLYHLGMLLTHLLQLKSRGCHLKRH
jgi:hypothetical protein